MDTLATHKQMFAGKTEEQVVAEYRHPFLVKVPREVVASKIAARTAYQERASLGVSRSTFRPDPKCEVFKVVRKETGGFTSGDRVFLGRGEDCDIPIAGEHDFQTPRLFAGRSNRGDGQSCGDDLYKWDVPQREAACATGAETAGGWRSGVAGSGHAFCLLHSEGFVSSLPGNESRNQRRFARPFDGCRSGRMAPVR